MPFPELKLIPDETLNGSDKVVFTVPDGETYDLLWVHVEFAATATAGNRQLVLQIRDADDDVVLQAMMGDYITNGETWVINFGPGSPNQEDETGSKFALVCLPHEVEIPAKFDVRVADVSAIDAAADDMIVQAMVERHQVGVD